MRLPIALTGTLTLLSWLLLCADQCHFCLAIAFNRTKMASPMDVDAIFNCAAYGEVDSLRDALSRCPLGLAATAASLRDGFDNTLLIEAAKNGHSHTVAFLADDCAADVDAVDAMGRSALHWAAGGGHVPTVELLLRRRAAIRPDRTAATPVHMASRAGHERVVTLLVAAGADVGALDDRGRPTMDWLAAFPRGVATTAAQPSLSATSAGSVDGAGAGRVVEGGTGHLSVPVASDAMVTDNLHTTQSGRA